MLNMNSVTGSVVYLSLFFTVLFQLYICVSIFFQKVHYFSIVFAFVVFCKQSFISFHPSSGTTSQMLDDCPLRLVLGFNHISALTKLSLDQYSDYVDFRFLLYFRSNICKRKGWLERKDGKTCSDFC